MTQLSQLNQEQIANHIRSNIRENLILDMSERSSALLGIGSQIIDILKKLISSSTLNVNDAISAAKSVFDSFLGADDPRIPNFLERILENMIWNAVEMGIRRLFQSTEPSLPTGGGFQR